MLTHIVRIRNAYARSTHRIHVCYVRYVLYISAVLTRLNAILVMELLTVKQASERLGVKVRTIQDRCKRSKIKKHAEGYMIPADIVQEWYNKKQLNDAHKNFERSTHRTPNASALVEEDLRQEIEKLRQVATNHQKLLRLISDRLEEIQTQERELKDISEELDLRTEDVPLGIVKSVHPPNTTEKTKDGKIIPKPSMNDINFQSSFNTYRKKE